MIPLNVWDFQPPLRALYALCVEPVCQRYDITRTELDILLFLANNPKYDTAAEISEVRHLAKSHVSTSLQSLGRSGYIVRSTETGDRRRVHLMPTEKSTGVIREGRVRQSAFMEIVLDGLNGEERRQLHALSRRMEQNVRHYLEDRAK